jgi:glycerol-3-phosphate dehydrogenase (NAD(P)+)
MTTVAVLGAGSWGTTLANLLAKKGQGVRLWAYEPEVVEAINREHRNPVFLPAVALAPGLRAFSDPREALERSDVVLSVIPSHAVRSVVSRLAGTLRPATLVVSATKGIEPDSLALMSQVLGAELPSARVAVLSGPSFAEEVCQDQPTAVVAASADGATAEEVQKIFATSRFRVYSNRDVVGVELGGALKNVIAIAAVLFDGKSPQQGVTDLMERTLKPELWR